MCLSTLGNVHGSSFLCRHGELGVSLLRVCCAIVCAVSNPLCSFLAVTPTYSAEVAPPKIRGLFVGLNGVMIALGYGLASYMGMAFFYAKDPAATWRGPLGLALLFPIIMLVILPFVPESPRFLLIRGESTRPEKSSSSCIEFLMW